jgi:predicted Fe-Mo cluster-binding NifX family protein
MKVVISANGMDLHSDASLTFGRCPSYVFVDTETMEYEGVANPAANAYGGAGIQAAQFVIEKGARAVLTGNVGPNAFEVLREADVPIFRHGGGSVRECVEAYKAGRLESSSDASVKAHAGMGTAPAREEAVSGAVSAPSRQGELAALTAEAADLRQRLAKVMERLDRLEKEG